MQWVEKLLPPEKNQNQEKPPSGLMRPQPALRPQELRSSERRWEHWEGTEPPLWTLQLTASLEPAVDAALPRQTAPAEHAQSFGRDLPLAQHVAGCRAVVAGRTPQEKPCGG